MKPTVSSDKLLYSPFNLPSIMLVRQRENFMLELESLKALFHIMAPLQFYLPLVYSPAQLFLSAS